MQHAKVGYSSLKIPEWVYYVLVVCIGFIPLFYNLGGPVLNDWDESRRAINAWEMLENGNYLVTHFNGEPDTWGSKPPLLIWTQAFSLKIFGKTEWALRFPSAVAGLLTGFLLIWFSKRYTGSALPGLISVLVLYTANGYINIHSVRTGDYDALLVFFTTAASLLFFLGVESEERKLRNSYIFLFFIFLTFGALTKSIAAFLMAPAYFLYLIYKKQLLTWLRNRNFWIGSLTLSISLFIYYYFRETNNPGYLKAVLNNEIAGRYFDTLEQHKRNFDFYFRMLYQIRFKEWYFLVPPAIILGLSIKDRKLRSLLIYCIFLLSTYLIIISFSQTKLIWYDLQVFPFLSIIVSIFFLILYILLKSSKGFNSKISPRLIFTLIIFFFFIGPYKDIGKQNSRNYLPGQNEKDSFVIKQYLKNLQIHAEDSERTTILYQGDFQHFLFYIYKLREKGVYIDYEDSFITAGNKFIVYQEEVLEYYLGEYNMEIYNEAEGLWFLKLNSDISKNELLRGCP